MVEPSLEFDTKTVLIFDDNLSLESVDDKIVALGYTFQKKALLPKPLEWKRTAKTLRQFSGSDNILAVLIFLSKQTLFDSWDLEYLHFWQNLLTEVKRANSLIFVDEDNFRGVFYNNDFALTIPTTKHLLREKFIDDINEFINRESNIDIINIIENWQIIGTNLRNIFSDLITTNYGGPLCQDKKTG